MQKPVLAMPRGAWVDHEPFGADKLARQDFALALTAYVDRLKTGAVIAIDAEWGHGKTWFAQNWKLQLENGGHPVIYVDAFQSDYIEDPFLLLAAEITGLLHTDEREKFISKAKDVALAIAPLALRLTAQAAGKWVLGSADIAKEFNESAEKAIGSSSDSLSKLLEGRIKNHKAETSTISAFREALSEFASKSSKPIVVIVDELDRCQPSFAVRLLERVKHLFDVGNVVFVLCMNKAQMCHAIQGVYGVGTDAHTYLEKFLNFTFSLPQPEKRALSSFVQSEFDKYEMSERGETHDCVQAIIALAELLNITPRQIERSIAHIALAYPIERWGALLGLAIVLKVTRPEKFSGLLRKDLRCAASVYEELFSEVEKRAGRSSSDQLDFLLAVLGAAGWPTDGAKQSALHPYHVKVEAFWAQFGAHARSINVPIS